MGKHSIEKKHNMSKIIIILLLALIICLWFFFFTKFTKKEKPVLKTTNNFFTAIKENNIDLANEYVEYDKLLTCLDDMFLEKNNENIESIKKCLFKDIKWDIKNVYINGNQATVLVELTNKNFKNIMTKWMKELVVLKSLKNEITIDLAMEKLKIILDEETSNKTVTKEINLYKENKTWKIVVNENLRDLIYPEIDNVISVLENNNI